MKEIPLSIHGGGRLQIYGSSSAQRLLILISRDQFLLDDALMARLVVALDQPDLALARYESGIAVTNRLITRPWVQRLPVPLQVTVKTLRLLMYPRHWRHFLPHNRRAQNAIPFRVHSLRELIRFIGPGREIILLGRSAGGRVATLAADQSGVSKVICLGYPFCHPEEGVNPDRYQHLAGLHTPCLILQGIRDSYGGIESRGRYPLSSRCRQEWIDTNHDFVLSETDWQRIVALLLAFIGPGQTLTSSIEAHSIST